MLARFVIAGAALVACAGTPSTFDFTASGDLNEHVISSPNVTGAIDNAGHLSLDDGIWSLSIDFPGLAVTPSFETVNVTLVRNSTGDLFSTTFGGSCQAKLDPHGTTNGDVVGGNFVCTTLTSSVGKIIDIPVGEFSTAINDTANDPNLNPPHP